MLTWCCAEGKIVLATWAVQAAFRNIEFAERTRWQLFWLIVLLNWSSCNSFNPSFEFWRDVVNIFRSNQHAWPNVSLLFQVALGAFTDVGGQYIRHVLRKLGDILANPNQQSCSTKMVAHFYQLLTKHIRVNEHQSVVEFERNSELAVFYVFECV
jgi:hypothetical protein